ncbi:hypothetical protein G1K66_01840 [Tenacibaculum finnmarkense]|uniref:hypothetical protein n=1 Tax=Tenacibaculum finnmarkense TaxID=2781243 RepID=UPI001E541111|nr:hypothetical protein [Tenacibaculum finnmarkense]MCD8399747.1 hypothetical protein [Tenacibaculum finnmarkense genomovar ulcerans]MCG8784311.1 hypothetical protein [Tenacibaculum finnmarkense]MCG8811997.1 hypothetical protein [Tenacibaculum finnmarkense]
MKKSILNLGKALNKAEQQTINGGNNACNFKYYPSTGCNGEGVCYNGGCRWGIKSI